MKVNNRLYGVREVTHVDKESACLYCNYIRIKLTGVHEFECVSKVFGLKNQHDHPTTVPVLFSQRYCEMPCHDAILQSKLDTRSFGTKRLSVYMMDALEKFRLVHPGVKIRIPIWTANYHPSERFIHTQA